MFSAVFDAAAPTWIGPAGLALGATSPLLDPLTCWTIYGAAVAFSCVVLWFVTRLPPARQPPQPVQDFREAA